MKVGLFFGSFNPIHVGHMVLANYMLSFTDLDRVWFIVSPHNPLKNKSSLLDEKQRLYLVNLAIGDNNKLKASNIEFKLPQPSYTINTLAHLKEKYPQNEFALILGADNLQSFHKWKNYEEILKYHQLYVYPRVQATAEKTKVELNAEKIKLVNAPVIEVSSTFIRQSIKEKKDVRYFMPESVWEYVQEMHFYKK
ncbi:MAG: nicotinate (nicotinamide) nucleotide adenylyltransferase [Bacteroidota bacterium]